MMTKIDTIIAELIALDSELAGREAELKKIIHRLQKAQPDVMIDATFARELKQQLLAELNTKTTHSSSVMTTPFKYMSFGALGAAAVAVPALAFVFTQLDTQHIAAPVSRIAQVSGINITETDDNAFGALSVTGGGIGIGKGGGGEAAIAPHTMVSDEELAVEHDMAESVTMEAAENTEEDMAFAKDEPAGIATSSMIAPGSDTYVPTIYRYQYDGALPALPGDVHVLRREPHTMNKDGTSILARLGLGLFDESELRDTEMQNLSIAEDRDYGYQVFVDAQQGTVNINKNWSRWPNPHQDCGNPACWEELRLTADDVLADEEAIRIAEKFVRNLEIDMNIYGEPVVRSEWRTQLLRAENPADVWIPDEIQVVYPLIVDGSEVREEWGNAHGLTVNVDIREERASGLWQLTTHDYSASRYAGVDAVRFAAALRDGSTYPAWQPEGTYNEIVITLGAPKEVYLQRWHWDDEAQTNSQLLVPALHFPIENIPDTADQWFSRTGVVLPLAADMYEDSGMRIMPLAEPMLEAEEEAEG